MSRGPILHYRPAQVGGVPIELGDTRFELMRCNACGFQFKDPPISKEQLLECYANGTEGNWGINVNPYERCFDVILSLLAQAPGIRVLDIGCNNGSLLAWLGDRWTRFGVEPSRAASAMAEARGITMLGATLDDISADHFKVDVVIAMDLVEHIAEPVDFFRRVAGVLVPGGICVIVTGDTEAWSWRWLGSRYWYCSLPEHVSFYNLASLQHIGSQCGMQCCQHLRRSHHRTGFRRKVTELSKCTVYWAGSMFRWGGIPLLQQHFHRGSPVWISARDHMFHVMKRSLT